MYFVTKQKVVKKETIIIHGFQIFLHERQAEYFKKLKNSIRSQIVSRFDASDEKNSLIYVAILIIFVPFSNHIQ